MDSELLEGLLEGLQETYGIEVSCEDAERVSRLHDALSRLSPTLVKACGVNFLGYKDLGPSREFYPNHGVYVANKLYLNMQNEQDVQVYADSRGNELNRMDHTLYHELGHGLDDVLGGVSTQDEWCGLSGWSLSPFPGGMKVRIEEEGVPPVVGEWYYDPKASFTRFYAKCAPWEDFADSFAFYVAGLTEFLPASKIAFFDNLLKDYR